MAEKLRPNKALQGTSQKRVAAKMRIPSDPLWDEFNDAEIVDWKRIRSEIEHEDNLTNHRLTWLLTSQGFLFTAFALVFQASTKTDVIKMLRPFYQYILAGMAITGILAIFSG